MNQNIWKQFLIPGEVLSCSPYGNGHINDTFLLTTKENEEEKRFILQRMNGTIFENPKELMENIERVTEHIRGKVQAEGGNPSRETLRIIKTKEHHNFYLDEEGNAWRVYAYIDGAVCLENAKDANAFYESAVAFGRFQKRLSDFDASFLFETIRDFHNTPKRFADFEEAVALDSFDRVKEVKEEITFLREREEEMKLAMHYLSTGMLPSRVTHNDTKLNNIMMDEATGKGLCVIDLDTVMPGLSIYDFGDSIRFGANTAAEDERDLSLVSLDLGLYESYVKGYLEECIDSLTDLETTLLPYGAKLMTLECGMRFLTDYLKGDVYFKIHRPKQNLDRSRTQFALVKDMEQKWSKMQQIVEKYRVLGSLVSAHGMEEIEQSWELYDTMDNREDYEPLSEEDLEEYCVKHHLSDVRRSRLKEALVAVKQRERLTAVFHFLIWDLCRERPGDEGSFYLDFGIKGDGVYDDCLRFLLLLSCIRPGQKKLQERGIPAAYYQGIPDLRITPQMEQFQQTGNCEVLDFPWDKNFYTGFIFLLNRFYFIPYRFGDPFKLYREKTTGKVLGIYEGEQAVCEETAKEVKGTFMNPCGILSQKVISLEKSEWEITLQKGDLLLALHIPSGPGYQPTRLEESMKMALTFYATYFPELQIRGFWSESWLYDNRLSFLLPEDSNIVQMQRRFYNYPIGGDGTMLRKEVWGKTEVDPRKVRKKTRLEKQAAKVLLQGEDFSTTSMIVLKEDVEGIEEKLPYICKEDLEEYEQVMGEVWKHLSKWEEPV